MSDWIVPEPALAQPGSPHFAPDLAGWRRERMPTMPAGAISVVPDWACEILSPTTRRQDHLVKMPFYAADQNTGPCRPHLRAPVHG